MKLSIITPVYNSSAYLSKCVDSLLAQTVEDMEIILVNDGSKDDSLKIVKSYSEKYPQKIKYLDIDNGGQGRARNFALNIAQGEYIGFCDSDDWAAPDMFETLLCTAEKEQADIVVCDSYRVEDNGEFRESSHMQGTDISAAGSIWNKLFRKDLIGDIRFPEGLWYEDFSFSAKLLMKSEKTVFIDKALYYYRSGHPSTMRNQNSRKNLDILTIMEEIAAFLNGAHRDELEFMIINHILLDSIKRVAMQKSSDRKQVIKALRDYVRKSIPNLNNCSSYKAETRNRRIVMWLNYHGLEDVALTLLKIKG